MHRILLMVRKDLLRRARAPLGIILLLAFPLLFSALLAVTFGGREARVPKVRLLVVNGDDGIAGRLLVGAFGSPQMARYVEAREVSEADAARLMEKGEGSALLKIPKRFTSDLLEGRPVVLAMVRNPAESILPEVAEQIGLTLADLLSSASRVLRGPLESLAPTLDADSAPDNATVAAIATAVNDVVSRAGRYVFPPAITLETATREAVDGNGGAGATGGGSGTGAASKTGSAGGGGRGRGGSPVPSIFLLVLPGISVYSLFMVGDSVMRDILTEHAAGTLRRQLSGPVRPAEIVVSKAMTTAVAASVALVFLSAVGWAVAPGSVSIAGFAVLSLALIVSVTGYASVMYGVARSERQGATLSSLLTIVLALSGGSFVPLDALPEALRRLSPLSLFYWGTSGYTKLLAEGGGAASILPNAAVLAGIGLTLLAVGGALLGRKVRG